MTIELYGRDAFENRHLPSADWSVARRRLRTGRVFPAGRPTFKLKASDTILTMGSCFARNIEKYLVEFGCRVPTMDFSVPPNERVNGVPNHLLTLFTPPTFLQALAWAEKVYLRDGKVTAEDCEPLFFRLDDGRVLDLSLAASTPITYERFLERRQELYELYAHAFSAECILMTPGLVEAWFDRKHGCYTNATPAQGGNLLDPERYAFRQLDYDESKAHLIGAIDLVRKHNPNVKFLITVSPVPLRFTFTGRDILEANTYSKSVLRAVCENLAQERPLVDYFPSYEAVMFSSLQVWQKDRRHVDDSMVREIVRSVISRYFAAEDPDWTPFKFNFWQRFRYRLASFVG